MTESALAGLQILVVDDEAQVRTVIEHALVRLGVGAVLTAADGVEALSLLDSSPNVSVLICDLEMPNLNALEVMENLTHRSRPPSIILISGGGETALRHARLAGESAGLRIIAALEKPLTVSVLEGALLGVALSEAAGSGTPTADLGHFVHEAAAPLMTIRMLAELLLDDPALSPSHADDVRRILTAASELHQLIRGLRR